MIAYIRDAILREEQTMKHLAIGCLTAIGIALMAAQPANATASLFICDNDTLEGGCAGGTPVSDPNISFTFSGFDKGFQINSAGATSPTFITENAPATPPPFSVDGAAENDFAGQWSLPAGTSITPLNQTIFFCNSLGLDGPGAICGAGETAVSDVLHFTYSEDTVNLVAHLDGFVYSDNPAFGAISIADLNAAGIDPTGFANELNGVYDFSRGEPGLSAKFQSDVPEIDAASGGAAIALLLGVLALVSERRRWRASELTG
jgi:hypothetical protein